MDILDRRTLSYGGHGCQPTEIILAKLDDNPYYPFVTWQRNIPELGGDGGIYWGHYFAVNEFSAAISDFHTRGKA